MACKVTLKLLVESPYQLHFVDEMRMEYGIMVRLIHHPDFREGVRAGLYAETSPEAIRPGEPERAANPRSRSAKLRWARKAMPGTEIA